MSAAPSKVIVIVGSAGSLGPLKTIMGTLPPMIDAAVIVLMHRSASRTSVLSKILSRCSRLPVVDAVDGQRIAAGVVYVVPAGNLNHSIAGDALRFAPTSRTNWHQGGDPLLRAAADAFGDRTIGVVLSGMGRNGEAGLSAVKSAGGLALVQDPAEAEHPSMPEHALEIVEPDFCGSAAAIAALLVELCGTAPVAATA